ncbi:MAG TPA: CvpA family protein [Cyclobacteriaceae bacterium]|nr:CvpA family protein [Cyclobacteriaceae bacterium]
MNWLDLIIGVVIVFGAISGYREGFLMEIISLLAIFLGVLAGFKFLGMAMVFLDSRFDISQSVLPFIAFAGVFAIIVILVSLLGRLIKASIGKSFLGSLDQGMGALVGMAKVIFMISVALWIFDSLDLNLFDQAVSNSKLASMLAEIAPGVTSWVGKMIPFFKDIFNR